MRRSKANVFCSAWPRRFCGDLRQFADSEKKPQVFPQLRGVGIHACVRLEPQKPSRNNKTPEKRELTPHPGVGIKPCFTDCPGVSEWAAHPGP